MHENWAVWQTLYTLVRLHTYPHLSLKPQQFECNSHEPVKGLYSGSVGKYGNRYFPDFFVKLVTVFFCMVYSEGVNRSRIICIQVAWMSV